MSTTIEQFKVQIEGFKSRTRERQATAVKKVAMDLWSGITKRTPVDTGRARANWMLTTGAPSSDIVYQNAKGKNSVPAPPPPDVSKITGEESVFIVNNLPYIEALENGHSQQAPNGMVKLAMQSVAARAGGETP